MTQSSDDHSVALRLHARWLMIGYTSKSKGLPTGQLIVKRNGRIEFTLANGQKIVSAPLALTHYQLDSGPLIKLNIVAGGRWYVLQLLNAVSWIEEELRNHSKHSQAEEDEALNTLSPIESLLEKYSIRSPDTEPVIAAAGPELSLWKRAYPVSILFVSVLVFWALILPPAWFMIAQLQQTDGYGTGAPQGLKNILFLMPLVVPAFFAFLWILTRMIKSPRPKPLAPTDEDLLPPNTPPGPSIEVLAKRRNRYLLVSTLIGFGVVTAFTIAEASLLNSWWPVN